MEQPKVTWRSAVTSKQKHSLPAGNVGNAGQRRRIGRDEVDKPGAFPGNAMVIAMLELAMVVEKKKLWERLGIRSARLVGSLTGQLGQGVISCC